MQTSESPLSPSPVARDQTEDFLNFLPGQRLRRARELRGLTIKEVGQELNLSVRFIEAIEQDHYDLLPGVAFARGYMRSYARLLHLDENDVVNKFDQALDTRSNDPGLTDENPVRILGKVQPARRWYGSKVLTYASLLVVVVMVGGAFLWSSRESYNPGAGLAQESRHLVAPQVIVPKPAVLHEAIPPADTSKAAISSNAPVTVSMNVPASSISPQPASSTLADDHQVTLSLDQPAWLRVTDATGQVVAVGMHAPGEQITLSGSAPWHLRIGNAEHVKIDQDGKTVDLSPFIHNHVADFELKP